MLLRRGTGGLTPAQLKDLLDNAPKVQAILDDIDARRAVFLETEKKTGAAADAAEKAEAAVAKREAAVAKDRAALQGESAEAAKKHQADMGALGRRTREVAGKEAASTERTTALDARERKIETCGRTRENELRGREEALEAQEAAAEEREREMHQQATDINGHQRRIETAAAMVKKAVAALG